MLDFFMVSTRCRKRGEIEIYPKFIIKKSNDLMIRGGDFHAIWVEERGLWSKDEQDAIHLIDRELDRYAEEHKNSFDAHVKVLHMWDAETGMIDNWHKYCQKQLKDNFVELDDKLMFSNMETKKTDYATVKLPYPLEAGSIDAYNKLMSTLYSKEERHKLEWAIGAIISGDSKKLEKFMVLYGGPGTGKSTVLNIIQKLFVGFYSIFDAKALGSASNGFALEAFRNNPLVAIQHDGDLSRIEDNTRINSLTSHEEMTVNVKFKSAYTSRFRSFLFMGTNKPVRITDSKSGIIRRLIDVTPTGNKVPRSEYKTLYKQIDFELGAIAKHCLDIYLSNPGKYDDYVPISMLGASNDFYNFILDSYHIFSNENSTTLKAAFDMYNAYCDEAKVPYPLSRRLFGEELKDYFRDYYERYTLEDGRRVRSYYSGFRKERFEDRKEEEVIVEQVETNLIDFNSTKSIFDDVASGYLAQYASDSETPMKKWSNIKTTLTSLDTSRLHYVKVPENHIVIDFDIPDENGNKCYEKNLEAASKWPPTYAELSKSGAGIHLHYIYTGDVSMLSRVYEEHIEIKVFRGDSSLRRKLTKCNNLPIANISSGLPMKGEKKMINFNSVKSEMGLRSLIKRNILKEIHPSTKSSIDFIKKILDDAYDSGLKYDVTSMRPSIVAFAANSTHQADYCLKLVKDMKFVSEEPDDDYVTNLNAPIVFYDVEVFPNLFLVNYKLAGEGNPVVRMINPTRAAIGDLMKFRLIGFNCRRYDNHILYGRYLGYDNEKLYQISQRIISGSKNAYFSKAFNLSYTDVYDFCATKQSLKKWEIELGIHHKELGLPWDQPVPEERWTEVAEYCDNDVIATEAVFNARQADFIAREVLADLAGMSVNTTTNALTTKIVFGDNKYPQSQFNYRDMGLVSSDDVTYDDEYTRFNEKGQPVFPGYEFEFGVSTYRGEKLGEGGYVYAEPGIYGNVALLDIASMHPSSIVAEQLFGIEYTNRFSDILNARIAIKHKDFDKARKMLGGVLAKYLTDESSAKDLAQALKIAINSVYGLTTAHHDNAFRDKRNIDNIVAKRGALFMVNLKHEVQKRGFIVAHIKTDSIKIPDATPEIIEFVMEYGKMYGYTFEHEATYDRMCLVNDAVYIAKYKDGDWTATGTQFAVPYVFKTLFSKEDIVFEDMCETKEVKSTLYLDKNEGLGRFDELDDLEDELANYRKKLSKKDFKKYSEDQLIDMIQKLESEIEQTHNYIFVGKVGSFCPIKPGCGGALLMREANGKYYAATGSKGYRWLEAEMVKSLGKEADIDRSYYDDLVTKAADTIASHGDFEWFVSDDPYVGPPYDEQGRPVYLIHA